MLQGWTKERQLKYPEIWAEVKKTLRSITPFKKGHTPWNKGKKWPQMIGNTNGFKKGQKAWNKDKKGVQKGYWLGKKRPSPSEKTRQKMKGKIPWNKGKEYSAIKGKKHFNWKGGITPINNKIRASVEYKLWRIAVFERDNYTCRFCGTRGGRLHSDHTKPFSLFPELRFAIDNGRTLCKDCHKKTNTFAGKIKNYVQ